MKLVCPSCGAVHAADAWTADAEARQALKIACELPRDVARHALAYLALFRPASGRALRWSRARRLLAELADMTGRASIQWGQQVARPCSPAVWARAVEQMVGRPPARLPLTSHGYLVRIAYDLADQADRRAEVAHNAAERAGTAVSRQASTDGAEPLSPEEIRRYTERFRQRRRSSREPPAESETGG